jgi:endonuclease YncB( thermonuclease family)
MKKTLLIILIALVPSLAFSQEYLYTWKVEKVIDGDTIKFQVPFLPAPLKPVLSVRILGVDTPEKKPRNKCDKENALAQKASTYVIETVAKANVVQVKLVSWDKYGGRVLGDVIVDGKSLSELLIQNGHARAYFGEKKSDWCI